MKLKGLASSRQRWLVTIALVPISSAEDEHDLYIAQGYVTAELKALANGNSNSCRRRAIKVR
jgi:hypothetical protein